MKTIKILSLIVISALVFTACQESKKAKKNDSKAKSASSAPSKSTESGSDTTTDKQWTAEPKMTIDKKKKYAATIVTDQGTIEVELYPADAPHAVNNFVFLARQGFYKNIIFHRVIKDFMIQTGDPDGNGTGGPGYTIEDDSVTKKYDKGTLAMANTGAPNSGGSQFFICQGEACTTLPPSYPIFGHVTAGLGIVDDIANADVEASDAGQMEKPVAPVHIRTITITES